MVMQWEFHFEKQRWGIRELFDVYLKIFLFEDDLESVVAPFSINRDLNPIKPFFSNKHNNIS